MPPSIYKIYIYVCVCCRVNNWDAFGGIGVNDWDAVGSIVGTHHFQPINNSGFRWLLLTKFSERGAKFPLFQFFSCGGCWWMLVLDDKKGGGKKIYKTGFLPPPSWEEEKGEKKREARGQKNTTFWGPLKRAGSSFTFSGPKFHVFKICKKSYF